MGEDTQPPSVIPMLTTLDEHNFYSAQQGTRGIVVLPINTCCGVT